MNTCKNCLDRLWSDQEHPLNDNFKYQYLGGLQTGSQQILSPMKGIREGPVSEINVSNYIYMYV